MAELVIQGHVKATACVNIALIKYWGKAPARDVEGANLPACPSLSLTLRGLGTTTSVRFNPDLQRDRVQLDGVEMDEASVERLQPLLDSVRRRADVASRFDITTHNTVPTAAGLASSASGAAALAGATARCAGLDLSDSELSALARMASGSGSRSVYGGWSAWDGPSARQLYRPDYWDVAIVVAFVSKAKKPVASRPAMARTRQTSPFYAAWVAQARETFEEARKALDARDLAALIEAMEASTFRMHASAMGARPPVLYWKPASLAVIEAVIGLRQEGVSAGWTMDAGPNVKVLCAADDALAVADRLAQTDGVLDTLVCHPGPGLSVEVKYD